MIANRRRPGTTSRKSSSRFPARSVNWTDRPVTLPPGRARLATSPLPTGSAAAPKTIGMTDVACFAARTGSAECVQMTSTLSRTNSATMSAKRSVRPAAQRYSITTVRPSIQPSSRSRCTKASVDSRGIRGATVSDDRFEVSVTFDERRGYVASAPELRSPVTALSLGGLRRRIEALMLPDNVNVQLILDRTAERERNRRRQQAQLAR
jgi:hypothetical protein